MPPRKRDRFLKAMGLGKQDPSPSHSQPTSSAIISATSQSSTAAANIEEESTTINPVPTHVRLPAQIPRSESGSSDTSADNLTPDREWASTCIHGVKSILKLVKEATDGVPVPGLRAAIGGVLESMNIYENVVGNKQILKRPSMSLDESERKFWTQSCRPTLEADMEDIAASAEAKIHKNLVARVADHEVDKDAIQEMNRALKECLDEFTLKTVISIEVNAECDRARASVEKLPDIDANFDSGSRSNVFACFPNTRTTVLSQILDWFEDPSDLRPIFWLTGIAGIGKTTIAQTIAEDARKKGCLGASFFFSRDHIARRQAGNMFPNLSRQLAFFNPAAMKIVARVVKEDPMIAGSRISVQAQKLFVPALQMYTQDKKVIIVIDALDECSPESGGKEILSALAAEIHNLGPAVRLLITSRPEQFIRQSFTSQLESMHSFMILHDIDQSLVQDDITLYLTEQFRKITHDFSLPPDWYTEGDIKALARKAAGLFIVAATSAKFIGDTFMNDPPSELRLLLSDQTKSGTSQLSEIDKLYLHVMTKSLPPDLRKHKRFLSTLQPILTALVLLEEPLSVLSLECFLSLPINTVRNTLSQLHSIILVPGLDDSKALVRTFHLSLPDFLLDAERCVDPRFHIDIADGHRIMASQCLYVLNDHLSRDICQIGDNGTLNSEVLDLTDRLERYVPPHLRYACIHVADHLEACSSEDSPLLDDLDAFCRTRLLMWLEVLSLLGELDHALPILQSVSKWVDAVGDGTKLRLLLDDIMHMLQRFFKCIQECALQLYLTPLRLISRGPVTDQYAGETWAEWIVFGDRLSKTPYLQRIPLDGYSADSLALSGDGKALLITSATGPTDDSLSMFDVQTAVTSIELTCQLEPVERRGHWWKHVIHTALSFDGSDVAIAREWKSSEARETEIELAVWSSPKWKPTTLLRAQGPTGGSIMSFLGRTGSLLYADFALSTVWVFDAQNREPTSFHVRANSRGPQMMSIAPDGLYIAALFETQKFGEGQLKHMEVIVWDIQTRQMMQSYTIPDPIYPSVPYTTGRVRPPVMRFLRDNRRIALVAAHPEDSKLPEAIIIFDAALEIVQKRVLLPDEWTEEWLEVIGDLIIISGIPRCTASVHNINSGVWSDLLPKPAPASSPVDWDGLEESIAASSHGNILALQTARPNVITLWDVSRRESWTPSPERRADPETESKESFIQSLCLSEDGARLFGVTTSRLTVSALIPDALAFTSLWTRAVPSISFGSRNTYAYTMSRDGLFVVEGSSPKYRLHRLTTRDILKFRLPSKKEVLETRFELSEKGDFIAVSRTELLKMTCKLFLIPVEPAPGVMKPILLDTAAARLEDGAFSRPHVMRFSPDGTQLVCFAVYASGGPGRLMARGKMGRIKLYDTSTAAEIGDFEVGGVKYTTPDPTLVFIRDNRLLVVRLTEGGQFTYKTFSTNQCLDTLDGPDTTPPRYVLIHDGWLEMSYEGRWRRLCWLPSEWVSFLRYGAGIHSEEGDAIGRWQNCISVGGIYLTFGYDTENITVLDLCAIEDSIYGPQHRQDGPAGAWHLIRPECWGIRFAKSEEERDESSDQPTTAEAESLQA